MYVVQYQAFKDELTIIRLLRKANIDSWTARLYKEYNGYTSEVKSKQVNQKKLCTCNHYGYIDNLWLATEVIGLYRSLRLQEKHSKNSGESESK